METILEQQRRYHEERERLIKLMVDEYATKKTSVSIPIKQNTRRDIKLIKMWYSKM